MKRLLLDTQALLWWDMNDPQLGGQARARIQRAPEVYVSAASGWEVTIKRALGKLHSRRTVSAAVSDSDFSELPITMEHVEAVGDLPMHHRDPFDRLILAVARVEGLTIVTSDDQFKPYKVPLIDATA
jgi:PIN domain nuclease of toxin-antitoxin system